MAGTNLTLKEYLVLFLKRSSIHGLLHFVNGKRHILENLLWIVIVLLAFACNWTLVLTTISRYHQNPIVISIERDKFSWTTYLPAITLCPEIKLNEAALKDYINTAPTANKTLLKEFIISLANANFTSFDTVLNNTEIHPEDYLSLLYKLRFKPKIEISTSGLPEKNLSLELTVTEMGICYCFNSQLSIYNSYEYWQKNKWEILSEKKVLEINPLDGEVFTNLINISSGYNVYIHGPFETADASSKSLYSPDWQYTQVSLTSLSIEASDESKYLTVDQRKCRFYYESNLKHSPVYSYRLCRMECRIMLAKRLCGCIMHFYRRQDNEKVCGVLGLHCLAKNKEKLIMLEGECSCLSNCNDVNYVVEDADLRPWFLGSSLQWGLKSYPEIRLKRDVIFRFSDLLVYIGGMVGLFFGGSVLSIIEIFYFVTIRFWVEYSRHRFRRIKN